MTYLQASTLGTDHGVTNPSHSAYSCVSCLHQWMSMMRSQSVLCPKLARIRSTWIWISSRMRRQTRSHVAAAQLWHRLWYLRMVRQSWVRVRHRLRRRTDLCTHWGLVRMRAPRLTHIRRMWQVRGSKSRNSLKCSSVRRLFLRQMSQLWQWRLERPKLFGQLLRKNGLSRSTQI